MATLYLQVESNRHYTSIMYIQAVQVGETEKAVKMEVENTGIIFWLPKAALKTYRSGIMKGSLYIANWFKFEAPAFKRIKEYIEHAEVTKEGFLTTG